MQSRFRIKDELISLLVYSKCWRVVHLLGIIMLIIFGIMALCSFSEPIDFHNHIIHEIEEAEKERQKEDPTWIEVEDENGNKKMVQIS